MKNEKWPDVKVKIKDKFSKLSDSDIDAVKGSYDELTSKVEHAYNYSRVKAESECKAFETSLAS